MTITKITDNPSLVRDTTTNAVLNTDVLAIKKHEHRVKELEKQAVRDKDIQEMKNDIKEIKYLLRQLSNYSVAH